MASRRNVEDRMLDAARACVEAFGIRRTTLTDVARRAGVSRPTVYRHWPDVTILVSDALTRELRELLQEAAVGDGETNAREHLVRRAAGVTEALLTHPLFLRIIDSEPELLATYTFHRLGTSHLAALELITPQVRAGQSDGSIRQGEPAALARMVLLVVQSVATSRRLTTDAMSEEALLSELRTLLSGYLAPQEANTR
ncbi:TetR family transcriptional regulator [Haloactinospora alba]|uniref:TetR family transcriptional regulator n=1 Tax=Haloactinospora alba TaxID=405555 RepID=A0A543NLL9_9ACTN|nr:TetR/AcrR family transcriptional regulator [Haloactinospora alba]TQN32704.1 TetR family transcriptional regulator [Haloactinospora alba]